MAVSKKGRKIADRIKKEVTADNARLEKIQSVTGKSAVVSGDLGCSDTSGCSVYCSES